MPPLSWRQKISLPVNPAMAPADPRKRTAMTAARGFTTYRPHGTTTTPITLLRGPGTDGTGQARQNPPGGREQPTEDDHSKKLQRLHHPAAGEAVA